MSEESDAGCHLGSTYCSIMILSRLLLLTLFTAVLTRHVNRADLKSRLTQVQTLNTKLFPAWKDGDPQYRTSWTGGPLKFDVANDAPTLTGAKTTFTIDIVFPHNQRLLPDGLVVWAENCTINGKDFYEGEPVYPETHPREEKQPPYVFVWKTCGKYWQVADGPSSSLTISTDDVPLGSYVMDVVIYHYRQKEKFIPVGFASTRFSVIDQIPFEVSITQVNDKDEGDQKFIQNRAVAFSISLHDPSHYLSQSDVTFNWNFGDESGTVISRELSVTHTYVSSGAFNPQVVVQAAIPDPSCAPVATENPAITRTPDQQVPADIEKESEEIMKASNSKDCVIYRYGSFSTAIVVVEGIENVKIVQVSVADGSMLTEMQDNAVDFKVTCQGSLPTVVCSVLSDADCRVPMRSMCRSVKPSSDCQLILRHFFNQSGTFCLNVSLTNDDSLALTNAKVNINIGTGLSLAAAAAMLLLILTVATVVASVAFAYKRLKGYRKLTDPVTAECKSKDPMPGLFWSLKNSQKPQVP